MVMSDSKSIDCELTVIGTGMAGNAAALFAVNRGLSTVQVGCTGEIVFASGFLDLFGVHPLEEKRIWQNPWAGIDAVVKAIPNHPYARVKTEEIRKAFKEFLFFTEKAGIPYVRRMERNCKVLSPVGTVKHTYCVPKSMWNQVKALEEKHPCLLIDFRGLQGFSARQIAAIWQNKWPGLRTARLSFPDTDHLEEVFAEYMAQSLELSQNREKLAQEIIPHIKEARVVGMPAIFGINRTAEVTKHLEELIGIPLFEIPNMPPSVPGLRLKGAFETYLQQKGVWLLLQQKVLDVHKGKNEDFILSIGQHRSDQVVKSKGIILATGRFLGKGLSADRKHIRETIFDLPVCQPENRKKWYRKDYMDIRGHPVNRAGLEIDDYFRPLGRTGGCAFETLFAAGSILAHQDWKRMKCGSGLSIATGYAAVRAFITITRSSKTLSGKGAKNA
jgi:glycerol-3-phosphate dehydrogenase subunit B